MPARTGEQFLKGLRGPREVWVDGERIADVVGHPKLTGAAHALAEVFDLHHRHPDILPMSSILSHQDIHQPCQQLHLHPCQDILSGQSLLLQ